MLEEALAQFEEIHPDVSVVPIAFPEDQILEEFNRSGNDGTGPALLIGNDNWIGELANAGLIRPSSPDGGTVSLFNSRNRALIQNQGQIFGVPPFLEPNALYYNKSLVTEIPETLDELLQEAEAGKQVAFVPRFEEAYGGIQAFGEGLYDDQGNFTQAESGFMDWLCWLDEAQRTPGVIMNVDDAS